MKLSTETPRIPERAPGIELPSRGAGERMVVGTTGERYFELSPETARLLELVDGHRDLDAIALALAADTGRALTAEQVRELLERTLVRAGLVRLNGEAEPALTAATAATPAAARPAASAPPVDAAPATARRTHLARRVALLPAAVVRPLARVLALAFHPAVAIPALAATVALHALALRRVPWPTAGAAFLEPGAWLAAIALVTVSLVVHELGHAAALAASGGLPGPIGVGLSRGMPVCFADVTAARALPPAGRARVDLGGAAIQILFAAALLAVAVSTGRAWLTLAAVAVELSALYNLLPRRRNDGAWILSDLAGFHDFAPLDRSLAPGPATRPARAYGVAAALAGFAAFGALAFLIATRVVSEARAGAAWPEWLIGATLVFVAGTWGWTSLELARALGPRPDGPSTEPYAPMLAVRNLIARLPWVQRATLRRVGLDHVAPLLPVMLSTSRPDHSPRALRAMARRCIAEMTLTTLDHADLEKGSGTHEIRNGEAVTALLRRGQGAIVCALHFGPYYYAAEALTRLGCPVSTFASPEVRERLDPVWERLRRERGVSFETLPASRTRGALAAVRAARTGRMVAIFMDGHVSSGGAAARQHRAEVRFLGNTFFMRTGSAWLAWRAEAPIVLAAAYREGPGRRVVEYSDPLPPPASDSDDALGACLQRMYEWFEPVVGRHPEQWSGWMWPLFHWKETGGAPRVPAEQLERELERVRALLAGDGRARLTADATRVAGVRLSNETLIVHGPTRRVLQGTPLTLALIAAAQRGTRMRDLAQRHAGEARLDFELARLTLAGLAAIDER